jgi:hypothetical protein
VQGIVVVKDSEGRLNLLAGTFEHGVYCSFDTGQTWFDANYGLFGVEINALANNNIYAFAGLYQGGVWRTRLDDILASVGDGTDGLPARFALHQNYPNPFNPSTTIEYDLPVRSVVTLRVLDVLGREVAILESRREMEPGRRKSEFNGSRLSSGLYFCEMTASGLEGSEFRQVTKMVVMK